MGENQTDPAQHSPSPEVRAAGQSGNAATDIVAGLLGKYANPMTGGVDAPQFVPPAQPVQQQVAPPAQPVQQQVAPPAQPVQQQQVAPPAQPVQQQVAPPAQPVQQTLADRYSAAPAVQPDQPIPDIPPETNVQLPQDENDKSGIGHAFATSRAEARQYRRLAEQMRQQLETARQEKEAFLKEKAEFEKQLLDGQTRAKDLEDQLGKLDLERSPAFRDKYDKPVLAIRDQLAQEFERNGVKPDEAADMANSVLNANSADDVPAILSGLPNAVQGMAIYKWQEATGLFNQRDQALSEWRQTQTGLEQVSGKETAVMTAQRRQEMCNTGFDRVSKVVSFWNDPAFDKYRQAQESNVKAWYSQASDDQIAAAAVEGALVAPFAYAQIEALQNMVVELQGRLQGHARLSSPPVSPYFHGTPTPPPPPTPTKPQRQDDISPLESAEQLVASTAARYGFVR